VREYFPAKEAGARIGIILMMSLFGMALGGWMSGYIFDLTGSYRAAFFNGIAWNAVNGSIVLWLLFRRHRARHRLCVSFERRLFQQKPDIAGQDALAVGAERANLVYEIAHWFALADFLRVVGGDTMREAGISASPALIAPMPPAKPAVSKTRLLRM